MRAKWKWIAGYEGLYKASTTGKIRSYHRQREGKPQKYLIQSTDNAGYLIVGLSRNGQTRTKKVHRLVAATFIPNPDDKPCINHKDGNKKNNQIDNLEWVTNLENSKHAFATGLTSSTGSKNNNAKLNEEKVVQIRARLAAGELQNDIAADYNVTQEMVSLIKRRRYWKHC